MIEQTSRKEITIRELVELRWEFAGDIFRLFYFNLDYFNLKLPISNKYVESIVKTVLDCFYKFSIDADFQKFFIRTFEITSYEYLEIPSIKFINFIITVEQKRIMKNLCGLFERFIQEAHRSGDLTNIDFLTFFFEKVCMPNYENVDAQLSIDAKELRAFIRRPDMDVYTLLLIHLGLKENKDEITESQDLIDEIKQFYINQGTI